MKKEVYLPYKLVELNSSNKTACYENINNKS